MTENTAPQILKQADGGIVFSESNPVALFTIKDENYFIPHNSEGLLKIFRVSEFSDVQSVIVINLSEYGPGIVKEVKIDRDNCVYILYHIFGASDLAIIKLTPDLTIDPTFSTERIHQFGNGQPHLELAGDQIYVYKDSNLVVKINSDGALDENFGEKGLLSFGGMYSTYLSWVGFFLDENRKFNFIGYSESSEFPGRYSTVAKEYEATGYISALLSTNFNQRYGVKPKDFVITNDNQIFIVGEKQGPYTVYVLAVDQDLNIKKNFGDGGWVFIESPLTIDDRLEVKKALLQKDGKILIIGSTGINANERVWVTRLDSNGKIDSDFGTQSSWPGTMILSGSGKSFTDAILQEDGKLLILTDEGTQSKIVRINTDGSMDMDFDGDWASPYQMQENLQYVENHYPITFMRFRVNDLELSKENSYLGSVLHISRHGGPNESDIFSGTEVIGELSNSSNIIINGINIGKVIENNGGKLIIEFGEKSTRADVNKVVQNLTYSNKSDSPDAKVVLDWYFDDGNTGSQGSGGAKRGSSAVEIDILSSNDIPLVKNLEVIAFSGDTIKGIFESEDLDGDEIAFNVTRMPEEGALNFSNITGEFTYVPPEFFEGVVEIGYTATDASSTSNEALVKMHIVNLVDVNINSNEEAPVTSSVGFEDNFGLLTYSVVNDPSNGIVTFDDKTGEFTYSPEENFFGNDSFTYRVAIDDQYSKEAKVNIGIANVDDLPEAIGSVETIYEDSSLQSNLQAFDVDGDDILFGLESNPKYGGIKLDSKTGAYEYIPDKDFEGVDSFTFSVTSASHDFSGLPIYYDNEQLYIDAEGGHAAFDIFLNPEVLTSNVIDKSGLLILVFDAENVALENLYTNYPLSNDNSNVTIAAELFYNSEYDQIELPIFYDLNAAELKSIKVGRLDLLLNSSVDDFTIRSQGSYGGDLWQDFNIPDFRVLNGAQKSLTADVQVTVMPVNDAPVINEDSVSLVNDGEFIGSLNGYDVDGDSIKYSILSYPNNGTISLDENSGVYSYTPNEGYVGFDEFSFYASDHVSSSIAKSVFLDVEAPTTSITALASKINVVEDTPQDGVLTFLNDGFVVISSEISEAPNHGTVELNDSLLNYTYIPSPDYWGEDSFEFRLYDGKTWSNSARVEVQVSPINDKSSGNAQIDGLPFVGSKLSLDTSSLEDSDGVGELSIRWLSDGQVIDGERNMTLVLSDSLIGRYIGVEVSYTDGSGFYENISSSLHTEIRQPVSLIDKFDISNSLFSGKRSFFGDIGYKYSSGYVYPEGNFSSVYGLSFANIFNKYEFNRSPVRLSDAYSYWISYSDDLNFDDISRKFDVLGLFLSGQYNITLSKNSDLVILDDGNDGVSVSAESWANWGGDDRVFGGAGTDTLYIEGNIDNIRYHSVYLDDGHYASVVEYGDYSSPIILLDFEYLRVTDHLGVGDPVSIYLKNRPPMGGPLLIGDLSQGNIVKADVQSITDDDGVGNFNYTWFSDEDVVSDSSEYLLTMSDVGKTLILRLEFIDGRGTTEVIYAKADTQVVNFNDPIEGTVVVGGKPYVGQTLTADASELSDVDGLGDFSYQWLADGEEIANATQETLTLTADDVSKQISVRVSYVDGGNTTEEVFSVATSAVINGYTLKAMVSGVHGSVMSGVSIETSGSTGAAQSDGSYAVDAIIDDDGQVELSAALASPSSKDEASITLTDVLGALKVYLGKPLPSEYDNDYKYVAADFEGDGDVDLSDVLGLLKYYLGKPVSSAPEWVFADSSKLIDGVAASNVAGEALSKTNAIPATIDVDLTAVDSVNLVGILRGDVDGSWVPGVTGVTA